MLVPDTATPGWSRRWLILGGCLSWFAMGCPGGDDDAGDDVTADDDAGDDDAGDDDSGDDDQYPTPPQVVIVHPDDFDGPPTYLAGDAIEFVAAISDASDPPAELDVAWASSHVDQGGPDQLLDLGPTDVGENGRTTLEVDSLPIGSHTVRCTATDTDAMEDSDYVSVVVEAPGAM